MAQRLTYEFFDRMIRKHTPRDWKVAFNINSEQDAHGMANPNTRIIHIPCRATVEVLLIFLHEVAHVRMRHPQLVNYADWHKEYLVERWAYTTARAEGVKVSKYRLNMLKGYVRKHYKCHVRVCKLYGLEVQHPATPGELRWMGL